MDINKQTEAAMKALSELSNAAKSAGNGDLMYAANRAWHELDAYQTVMLKDKIAGRSRHPQ